MATEKSKQADKTVEDENGVTRSAKSKTNRYRVKVLSHINGRHVGVGEIVELPEGTEPGDNLEPLTDMLKGEPIIGPSVQDLPAEGSPAVSAAEARGDMAPASDKGTIHTESTHDGNPHRPPPDYNDGHANDTGKWQREVGDAGKEAAASGKSAKKK